MNLDVIGRSFTQEFTISLDFTLKLWCDRQLGSDIDTRVPPVTTRERTELVTKRSADGSW